MSQETLPVLDEMFETQTGNEFEATKQSSADNADYLHVLSTLDNSHLQELLRGDLVEPGNKYALKSLLIAAENNLPPQECLGLLASLRERRNAGGSNYRINSGDSLILDDVVVELIHESRLELAQQLMSSSDQDPQNLLNCSAMSKFDEPESTRITDLVFNLHAQKQANFRTELLAAGAHEPTIIHLLRHASDPDAASHIPAGFWQLLDKDPSLLQILTASQDNIAKTAQALFLIEGNQLASYRQLVLNPLLRCDDMVSYLQSFKNGVEHFEKYAEKADDESSSKALQALADFEDPTAALRAAEVVFGQTMSRADFIRFHKLMQPKVREDGLTTYRDKDITALCILKDYLADDSLQLAFTVISGNVSSWTDPVQHVTRVCEALTTAPINLHNILIMTLLFATEKPHEFTQAVAILQNLRESVDQSMYGDLCNNTVFQRDQIAYAEAYATCVNNLLTLGVNPQELGFKLIKQISTGIVERHSNFETEFEEVMVVAEYILQYSFLLPELDTITCVKTFAESPKPAFDDLPFIKKQFKDLGFDDRTARNLFQAWQSYAGLKKQLHTDDGWREYVYQNDVQEGTTDEAEQITDQLEALRNYIKRYSLAEANAIIEEFGIHNFIRHKPKHLHKQLKKWENTELVFDTLVLNASSDWNGAFNDIGGETKKSFGKNAVCFEVSNPRQIARVISDFVKREKSAGRDPAENATLKNIVFAGHANALGIKLGDRDGSISRDDLLASAGNQGLAKAIQKRLGVDYRVILQACLTAAIVDEKENFAESSSKFLGVRVDGADSMTWGKVTILPDDSVLFNNEELKSTAYLPR